MSDLVNSFLNFVAPLTFIFSLILFYLPFIVIKFLLSIFHSIISDEDMRNKVVVITGASSGIGEQLAYQYAKRGANLALVARREKRLQEVADRARCIGSPDVIVIPGDVSKAGDCKRFIEETISYFGRLDHLVNNAGIACICMLKEVEDISKFSAVMDVNFWGSVYPTYFAIPQLRENRGKIVVIASAAGWCPLPMMSFYNASKAAAINFYETLRMEFGSEIKITIATPGIIASEMTRGKFIRKGGEMVEDIKEATFGRVPMMCTEGCAEAIVNSACRGKRSITMPSWMKVIFLCKILAPDVVEWCCRLFFVAKLGPKKILDAPEAKKFMYTITPSSSVVKSD